MSQSINFLKALPVSTNRLSAVMMGAIVLAMLAVLVIFSIILGLINFQAHKSLKTTQKKMISTQREYNQLAKAYPLLASDIPFVTRVKDLEGELQAKKERLNSLEHLILRRGFSEYMLDLAQATSNTLWLNQIKINHDSANIILNGYAINPHAVPEFMSRLLTTNAFKDFAFNLFFVKRIKERPYLKFSIATHELGEQEEPATEPTAKETPKAQGAK